MMLMVRLIEEGKHLKKLQRKQEGIDAINAFGE